MNRYFHLYPDSEQQQRLRLSGSLKDIHYQSGFRKIEEDFGVSITEAEEKLVEGAHQELVVRPPIPEEQRQKFARALLNLVAISERIGSEDVGFIDHTGKEESVVWLRS